MGCPGVGGRTSRGVRLTMGRYSAGLSTSAEASSGAPYTGWLRWPMSTRSRSFCLASWSLQHEAQVQPERVASGSVGVRLPAWVPSPRNAAPGLGLICRVESRTVHACGARAEAGLCGPPPPPAPSQWNEPSSTHHPLSPSAAPLTHRGRSPTWGPPGRCG